MAVQSQPWSPQLPESSRLASPKGSFIPQGHVDFMVYLCLSQ